MKKQKDTEFISKKLRRTGSIATYCTDNKALKTLEDHFLKFWGISYEVNPKANESHTAYLIYGSRPPETISEEKPALVIPTDGSLFKNWLEEESVKIQKVENVSIEIAATKNANMTLMVKRFYNYQSQRLTSIINFNGHSIFKKIGKKKIYLFSIDVVSEFQRILNEAFNAKASLLFKIYSYIPVSYTKIPPSVRNYLLWQRFSRLDDVSLTYEEKLPLDALRYLFLRSLRNIVKLSYSKHFWPHNKKYALCITHDVETYNGLKNSLNLKNVERRCGVKSTWNILTRRYPLDLGILAQLAKDGEIGAHGTKHDGKLLSLNKTRIVKRIEECRKILTKVTHVKVDGFRTPLLQHSHKIIEAASEANYLYTSTSPTWEPKHPTTLQENGIGTTFPLIFNGIVEIPVTLPQDQQLLHILKKSPKECLESWEKLRTYIKGLGGLCTLLIHPDYSFGNQENLEYYQKLIESFNRDPECWIATANEVAKWWKIRMRVHSGRMKEIGV